MPVTRTAHGAELGISSADLCDEMTYATRLRRAVIDMIGLGHLCERETSDSVKIALISDTQELHEEHEQTGAALAAVLASDPEIRLVVNAGDIVDAGTDTEWSRYRAIASKHYSARIPLVPVIGNHEYFEDPEISRWQKVYGAAETRSGFYAIDLGAARLIVLDSSIDYMPAERRDEQTRWLERTLRETAGDKPVVVTFHHPAYSSGIANVFMPLPPRYVQEHWLPLFQEFGVRLVMNGHEHVYERLTVGGVPHVIAGPAGGKFGRTKPWNASQSEFLLPRVRTVTIVEVHASGAVDILTRDVADGRIVDRHTY